MSDDVVKSWMRKQRVETRYARDQFVIAAKAGFVSTEDLVSFCELASQQLNALEAQPAPRAEERSGPCQCANCLGYNGWFAACSGYRP